MSNLGTKKIVFKIIDLDTEIETRLRELQKRCPHSIIFGKHDSFDHYICPKCGKRDTSFGHGGWDLNSKDIKWISSVAFDSIFKEKEIVLLSKDAINKIIKNILEKI
ncbi:MAG: hypothetical protein WC842_01795 [Candidatus Paceibacterota bacterium]|jgi:hypothetical protein